MLLQDALHESTDLYVSKVTDINKKIDGKAQEFIQNCQQHAAIFQDSLKTTSMQEYDNFQALVNAEDFDAEN